jgi:polysaccharide biosynthesis transport protein
MGNIQNNDIRRFIELVLRKKYLALSVALAVLSLFTWGSFVWPKTYEASSTVLIEKSTIMEPLIQGVGFSDKTESRLASVRDSIMSRTILERVAKTLNAVDPGQYDSIIERIRKNLTVTIQGGRESGPDIFTIAYRGKKPELVRDTVNTLIKEYIGEIQGYRKTDVTGAFEFIRKQVEEYKSKLEESDKALREFREKNPNMVPQSENAILGRLETSQTSRMEAEIKLKELTRKKENLQKQLSGEKELTVAFVTNEGSPQGRLGYLNNQLMILMSKYTEDYPEVIKVKNEIEELKKQISQPKTSQIRGSASETSAINPIYQQLREELTKVDAEAESLRGRVSELSRQQHEGQSILGHMPREMEEWTKLQRDRNVYQKIYEELLQKLEQARVSTNLQIDNKAGSFKVIEPAILPRLPIHPNRVLMILLGIALGLASGVGVVMGLEQFNHSFRDEASIESVLKLSVLATIPRTITAEEKLLSQKHDKYVFTAAGAYFALICLVLVVDFLYRYMGIRMVNF